MAAAADLSPRPRRSSRSHNSPWSQVVRGESDPASPSALSSSSTPGVAAMIATPEAPDRQQPTASGGAPEEPPTVGLQQPLPPPSDGGDQGAAAREKKTAWRRSSNGTAEAEPVMGAVSWPALSEATKASSKSSSVDSLKSLSDGSVFAPPAPVISSPPPKQTSSNSNSNVSTNYGAPGRQKSAKRAGGVGPTAGKGAAALPNGKSIQPLMPSTSSESPRYSPGKVMSSEPLARDLNYRGGSNWDNEPRGGGFSSHLHGGNEHQRGYGSNKRGNGGGVGLHFNPGNRREQERGGAYDWSHRHFGGSRDMQMQQRSQHQPRPIVRPFIRPPTLVPPPPFITHPPPRVSPFGSPMGYHDIPPPPPLFYFPPPPPPESLGGVPVIAPPAMFFPAPDPQLQLAVAKQIEYYFSPENLCKDIYLRQNMDEEGWVHASLIAGFNRVKHLTNNIQFILETVKASTVVEVLGERIRRRNDWMNWPSLAPTYSSPHSSTPASYESLAARVGNVALDGGDDSRNDTRKAAPCEEVISSSSEESSRQPSRVITFNGTASGQNSALTGSDPSCPQDA